MSVCKLLNVSTFYTLNDNIDETKTLYQIFILDSDECVTKMMLGSMNSELS